MTIQGSPQLPVDDLALKLLTDMTAASISGDTEALRKTIEDWGSLTPTKKAEFEQLISQLIPPWILPMQLFIIFSNPDENIGIGRAGDTSQRLSDITTNSIIMSALTKWIENEHELAKQSLDNATTTAQTTTAATTPNSTTATTTAPTTEIPSTTTPVTTPVSNNPVDALLTAYIASAGSTTTEGIDTTQTMQFLRNNPILLSGLQTANPALLDQAYKLAESQIVLGCLDQIIQMQARIHEERMKADRQKEAVGLSPQQQLLNRVYSDIKDGTIPLTQATFMVMQLLLVGSGVFQVGAMAATTAPGAVSTIMPAALSTPLTGAELAANLTVITSAEVGLATAKALFPGDIVATSVLVSLPFIYEDRKNEQLTATQQLTDLAQLASATIQMVPYWTMPAAITFQQAAGASPKTIPESAVRAFIAGLVALIHDPAFTTMIQNAILKNATDPSRISPEQLKSYTAAIKIALLANALVALAKVYQHKSNEELARLFNISVQDAAKLALSPKALADIILRDTPMTGTSVFEELVKYIKEFLEDIPQEDRENFIRGLFGSFSSDSSIESLIDPSTQFLALFDYLSSSENTRA